MNQQELDSIIQRLTLLYEKNHELHRELAAERKRADAAAQFLHYLRDTSLLKLADRQKAGELAYQIQLRKPE